jgi:8-oxo-dGTP pyrophosphatase MutT (NUDIX family)
VRIVLGATLGCMALADDLRMLGDELRSLAEEGLQWSDGKPYDRERYERARHIAAKAFALADERGAEEVQRTVFSQLTHSSPVVCADAATIDADGRILLIRRADDGLWAMPGGGVHPGETAAEGACREALEEAGVDVHVTDLVGVYDSRFCGANAPLQLALFTFLCEPVGELASTTPHEVLDVGWFAADALPPLSPGHHLRVPDVFRFLRDRRPAFDGGAVTRRHPDVERLIADHDAFASADIVVWGGDTRLQMHGYAGMPALPDDLVTSVRGIVTVPTPAGPHVVVCTSVDGDVHPWPGGRRELGETHAETLAREVHEETGWRIDPSTMTPLGWLRFAVLSPRPAVTKGPHPDFLQVVYAVTAVDRDGGPDADWTDTEGQELSSRLVERDRADALLTGEIERAFVRLAFGVER